MIILSPSVEAEAACSSGAGEKERYQSLGCLWEQHGCKGAVKQMWPHFNYTSSTYTWELALGFFQVFESFSSPNKCCKDFKIKNSTFYVCKAYIHMHTMSDLAYMNRWCFEWKWMIIQRSSPWLAQDFLYRSKITQNQGQAFSSDSMLTLINEHYKLLKWPTFMLRVWKKGAVFF